MMNNVTDSDTDMRDEKSAESAKPAEFIPPVQPAGATHAVHPVAGLTAPVDILIDTWGIPHIRAGNTRDAFVAQGFNAARDRLWQIDLWRKRGLGLLAADFGPGYIEQDRAARLFLYRGDMQEEWRAYTHPQSREIAQAFVEGINAYVNYVLQDPDRLPIEFQRLGTRPLHWQADDVVRIRTHSLMRNADFELKRALVMAQADAQTDLLRRSVDPARTPHVASGLDLASLDARALDALKLACAPVTFSAERLACQPEDAWRWRQPDVDGEVSFDADAEGSNNWAIAPTHTATGRAILASDPHRAYPMPSLRYLVHLQAPGLDVVGAGEPAQPGICIGHNGTIAFGLTLLMMDQEDLVVLALDPADPTRYRDGDGWVSLRIERESLVVKGQPAAEIELCYTRHGPVTWIDTQRNVAYAVRTVWTEPGSAPYYNSLGVMVATDLDQYRQALHRWSVPAVNHVYADTSGHIAWVAAGKWPRRPNWDGLLPVPGDGRYEWDGFWPGSALPSLHNPACGYVASANENKLPDGDAWRDKHLSYEWAEDSRASRIDAVLGAGMAHTVQGSMDLQCDTLSLPARRLCSVLAGVMHRAAAFGAVEDVAAAMSGSDTPDAIAADSNATLDETILAWRLLQDWNGHLDADSAAAALCEVWWAKFLRPALLDHFSTNAAIRPLLEPGDVTTLMNLVDPVDGPAFAARDALMRQTLAQAYAFCIRELGPRVAGWAWGALHHGYFEHAVGRLDPQTRRLWDAGPYPLGGSAVTVMNTSYRLSDFRATMGASVRLVMDVGAWDGSVAINAPGQSGDPASCHYADMAARWCRGQYVPMLYSREAVDAAVRRTIRLVPAH